MNAIVKGLIAVPLCVALWAFSSHARAGDIEAAMEAYENGRYALAVEHLQAAGRAGYMACAIRRDALSARLREPPCVERVAEADMWGLR
jgi:hypothetical protein